MLPPKPFSSWKNRKKFKATLFSSSEEYFEEMKQCVAHKYPNNFGEGTLTNHYHPFTIILPKPSSVHSPAHS